MKCSKKQIVMLQESYHLMHFCGKKTRYCIKNFGVISTITFVTLLLVVCFYTDVITLPIKMVLMVIAISVFGVGLYVAMWGDRKIGYFKCRNCNELFTPTFMQYNMGMHLLSTRYLKCPHCKTRTWCKKVMTKEC